MAGQIQGISQETIVPSYCFIQVAQNVFQNSAEFESKQEKFESDSKATDEFTSVSSDLQFGKTVHSQSCLS